MPECYRQLRLHTRGAYRYDRHGFDLPMFTFLKAHSPRAVNGQERSAL